VVYANIFEGLTRFDPNGAVIPALAESWDISEDGLEYTFHLHSGVTFHDGTTFDAEDVKFSLDRARADDSTNAQKVLFESIASVDVIDPQTVKVTLSAPNGDFLFNLAWGDAVIVAPESADGNATNPVGTGPFTFANWVQGDHIEIAKNPNYWGTPVQLDKATFRYIGDPTAAMAALQAGDVDAFPFFPAPELLDVLANDPRFVVDVGSTEGETVLGINNERVSDVKVREAITHAIDRQAIIDGAMFGYGTPIGSFMPPTNPNYIDLTGQSNYDPEKSKALLAEAGWDANTVLSLKLPPVEGYARRGGEIIAQQLAAVGIKTETVNLEWAQWLSDVFTNKDYDLTIISHTEPNDIVAFARDDYYWNYKSDAVKALFEELNLTTDPARRTEILHAVQQQIADDYAIAFLFQLPKTGVWNAKLKGMWSNAPTQATDLTGVYWEQ
jgi:peptide/nickel transport system substrate-binding protein